MMGQPRILFRTVPLVPEVPAKEDVLAPAVEAPILGPTLTPVKALQPEIEAPSLSQPDLRMLLHYKIPSHYYNLLQLDFI